MAAKLNAPVDAQIELTQACNWRCRHCYNYWRSAGTTTKPGRHLSCENLFRIVQELVTNQVPSITITGGEPFSQRREIFMLLETAERAGIHASINTNLSLVKKEDIEKLANKHSNVSILFSLLSADAAEHEHLAGAPSGSYVRVIEIAALAIQHGIPVSLNMVLMRENLHAMEVTARLAKNLGVRTFCATKALPNAHAPDSAFLLSAEEVHWSLAELMRIEELLDIPVDILGCYPKCFLAGTPAYQRFSHRTCVAGYTTVTIGADGKVRPCSHLETSYGNIFHKPLADIWQEMDGWREGEFIPEECHGCPVVTACRGGCRVNTLTSGLKNMDCYADTRRLVGLSQERLVSHLSEEISDIPTKVMVCPQVGFRNEPFGALVYRTDPLAIVLVNHSAVVFLKTVAEKGEKFDFLSFLKRSGARTKSERKNVERLYQKLIRKGFLIKPANQQERRK
ncbi:MAG: Radical SAM domain-containing protein [Candidatus Giovannonibacteria bacterium GW2011_GWC2_44_9]|uniref:Radical SAM domain-containing protein n=3 Tax=Candidatus Giovannoniibacteriota TaxID=1752738 RepID=A0A0G1IWH6_9BACT|nr:MAG: Radical SAM domain-containing protein [Candidatus Giovannonibacteria bacterium GW2011_GWB1_44_23]KKT63338.1 MAG: Radical SAM domain-containing protein [Candidatus Giovannonibacteria bacterium GW2011_GWA1_44_29]KKT83228.1 MAG: Radical SAM domain-containing protein [Candidatus Giovannonibacteria bacterium GW2011_GWC2_44_9]KKT91542.1 MAG: radical SAM domain protein [Parcubacteria group bacterium GW2011_GWC1_45_13]